MLRIKAICPLAAGLLLFSVGCTGHATFTDISPNLSAPTTAGLTIALAGQDNSLFAVSLNAAVWHRSISPSGQRTWSQLRGPRYAISAAVDPANSMHVAIGEKNGDATENRLNEAGLWESFDQGSTWSYALNPTVLPDPASSIGARCPSQVVPSVVFTSSSTLIGATGCGIARKDSGSGKFAAANVPVGIRSISALAASPTKVWARTLDGQLLVSGDDGKNFGFATTKPLPPGVSFSVRGDSFSLAASDSVAVMSGCCASSGPAAVNGHPANELIVFQVSTGVWSVEPMIDSGGKTITEGVYLGGRRFLRSFNTQNGTRFFFSNGQAVWEWDPAVRKSSPIHHRSDFTLLASTGVDIPPPTDPEFAGGIHNDLWDFSLDPSGSVMWIACDGGVYENRMDGLGWKPSVDGLHTQHVQALDTVLDPSGTRMSYATQDNDAWYGMSTSWKQTGLLGDTNWSNADAGGPDQAFFFRSFDTYAIVSLNNSGPTFNSATSPRSVLADKHQPDRPGIIEFIQSTKDETGIPLDALTVVHRPVLDASNPPMPVVPPASLSGIEQAGNPWLLRNRSWSNEPDFYRGIANGNWQVELKDLPDGTERIFESGGHNNPHYFALVRDSNGLSLFDREIVHGVAKKPQWVRVFQGIIDWTTHCAPFEGWYGPVFVNPYDSSRIFLLAPGGAMVSHRDSSGNLVFANDAILTNLITASSTYPITSQFCGGNSSEVVMGSRVLGTNTLGHVAFFRDDSSRTIVSSPYTGVFYDSGDHVWRSFSNILPQGPIWAVRLDKSNAYIGFAGRSVGQVSDPGDAARGTYFVREEIVKPRLGGELVIVAKLMASDGSVVYNGAVSVTITGIPVGPSGEYTYSIPMLNLDTQGQVVLPLFAIAPGAVVHIHFAGDEKNRLAASEIHFSH